VSVFAETAICIVEYRPVTGQRPRKGLRVQPLLCNRRINKHSFLGNGSINMFPWQRIRMQHSRYCWTISMETVFSIWFVPKCYKQGQLSWNSQPSIEAGSNTSTVVLRVVWGDEKGTQCPGYSWATLFPGDVNTGTWPSRLGEPGIWEIEIWSWVPQDSDRRMTVLARTVNNCKRQTNPLVRDDVT
jgi:hypothetical protein